MPRTKKTVSDAPAVDSVVNESQQPIVAPKVLSKKERIEQIKKDELRLVKGRFKFYKCPGGSTTVQVKKYKDVPEFKMVMADGGVYEVPLYVARFLNGLDFLAEGIGRRLNTCSYPVHAWAWPKGQAMPNQGQICGDTIVPILSVGKREQRVGFESLEFGEINEENMGQAAKSA